MAIALSPGEVLAAFAAMRIQHPRLTNAQRLYDSLRQMKTLAPNAPQRFGALFAPPQSGKSMSATIYLESRVADEAITLGLFPADMTRQEIAKNQRLVLHVTLSAKATPKTLASDILRAFGDPRATSGTTESLLKRAYDYMRHHGTSLLFIDEIQHLGHRVTTDSFGKLSRANVVESSAVTDTLKCMLLNGLVPMIFIGIPEARPHLFCDPQLSDRCVECLDFDRLDFRNPEQRTIFRDYCGNIGLKLAEHGVFEEPANLVVGDIPACIHEVAGGRIGAASNLATAASVIGVERGAKTLEREHLSDAVDQWAIVVGLIDYNPFIEGIRSLRRRPG